MSARRPLARLLTAASSAAARFHAPKCPMQLVPGRADVFAADELPPVADIEAEAAQFFRASEQARAADRAKRASRKLLGRLPAGMYGAWRIEHVAGGRETADLDAIRAVFTANGLGEVPMKPCAPSLKVSPAKAQYAPESAEASLRTLAAAA